MERSQKRMLPPASGVTVIVDLDLDNEEQKLTIHSKSKQFSLTDEAASQKNMMTRSGNNPKEDPSTSASTSSSPSTSASTSGSNKPKRLECIGNHFPELMPDKMAKSCLCCSSVTAFSPRKPNGKLLARHQTRYWCPDCKTPLCISPRPCFKRYHTVEEYFKYVDTTVRTGPLVSSTAQMYPPPTNTNEFPREYPKQVPFNNEPRQNPFVPPIQNPFGDPRQNPFVTPPNMKTEMMPPMNPMNMTSNMKTEMMPPMNMAPYPPIIFPHHESA